MHPWIGAGDDDRRRMLTEIGLDSIDELFASIPAEVCVDRLAMDDARDETAVRNELSSMALANLSPECVPSFLGAGVYRHVQPSVVDAVLSRAEFFTSYTPYQPEISQGTLQVIFEFQTLICQLTGMEIANASLYDGATALVEAVLFAHRVKRGKVDRVVLAETVHPDLPARARHLRRSGRSRGGCGAAGRRRPGRRPTPSVRPPAPIRAAASPSSRPTSSASSRTCRRWRRAAHAVGALAIQVVTEGVSLALLAGGGAHGYDVVCGEAQSFGIAPGYGGPHLGFFTCREKNVRQMPGRLVGETVDSNGQRAFCLTLSTREQHIRRAKATSNICTNQGLMALAATIWLESIGAHGSGRAGHREPVPQRGPQATNRRARWRVATRLSREPDLQRVPARRTRRRRRVSLGASPTRASSPESPPTAGAARGPTDCSWRSPSATPPPRSRR